MVPSKFTVLGLPLTKDTPTTAEWQAKWGDESLRLEATNNVWYRATAPEVRDLFLHGRDEVKDAQGNITVPALKGVDDITGKQRKVKTVTLQSKNVDGSAKTTEAWDETEGAYFKRVCAELTAEGKFPTVEAATNSFNALLQTCADLCEFDASKAPPAEKKVKSLPQVFILAAQAAMAKGNGQKLAKLLSKSIGQPVGRINADTKTFEVTVEELAKAMKADDDMLRQKRQADLAALVNG